MTRRPSAKIAAYTGVAALALLAGLALGRPELVAVAAPLAVLVVAGLAGARDPELDTLLDLASSGIASLVKAQKQALGPMLEQAAIPPLRRLALGPASLDLADGRAG